MGKWAQKFYQRYFFLKVSPAAGKKIYTFTKNDAKGTAGYSFYKLKCIT